MDEKREHIKKIIETFEELGKQHGFRNFETAIAIWMRSDLEELSNADLQAIDNFIYKHDGSLLNDDIKDFIDILDTIGIDD